MFNDLFGMFRNSFETFGCICVGITAQYQWKPTTQKDIFDITGKWSEKHEV